ncbi:MAG TPA: radical SAM protein [Thermoanaerobaculia bacterium]|jgi:MoaA/NifB/PqqE/SkfB family radical SAM enzyme
MTLDQINARSWNHNRLFSVLIELTYRCNLDCFFCYNDLGLRGKPLSFEQYDAFLTDLASMNVLNIALTGGEPLAHPDFFRIGARARELGFVVRVKSNGHALHGALARRLRDEVDPFVIEVSLHGATAATHDRQTRVPGSFDRLLSNIREMLELGLRLKVNSTLTRWNEQETAAMYALTDSLGLPLRFDLQVSPRDNGDREPLDVAPTPDGIRTLLAVETARYASFSHRPTVDDELPPPATDKHCGAGSAGIAIDPYGNVYPCVQWRRSVANLHDQPIAEIWGFSRALEQIREETTTARKVVAAHPLGGLLNFCPGLAEVLTGSATTVPVELERQAAIVDQAK